MTNRDRVLAWLEGRKAVLFIVAGGLFVIFAGLHGVETFMDRSAPKDIFGPAGFACAFLGMLGLYRKLVNWSPWLSRFGAVFAIIGLVASVITSVLHIALWVSPSFPDYGSAIAGGMVLGQFLAYIPFGLASLRTNEYSRTAGVLLLAVPTILAVMIVTVATGYATSGSAVVLGSVQAFIHFAIGNTIQAERSSSERRETSGEPAP